LPAAEALAVKKENIRTVRLRLLPTPEQEIELERLGDLCARMWNELNYERMQLFKQGKLTAEAMGETYRKYYEKYKGLVGSPTAQQIANMNNVAWKSFFATLKAKREGRLPPFIKRISPPSYWKDLVLGKMVKRIVIRSDRYIVEPINAGEGYIVLRDYELRIKYAGKVK